MARLGLGPGMAISVESWDRYEYPSARPMNTPKCPGSLCKTVVVILIRSKCAASRRNCPTVWSKESPLVIVRVVKEKGGAEPRAGLTLPSIYARQGLAKPKASNSLHYLSLYPTFKDHDKDQGLKIRRLLFFSTLLLLKHRMSTEYYLV